MRCEMPKLQPIQKDLSGEGFFARVRDYFARRQWRVVEDYLIYLPWLEETWCVPAGFVFDGASVPRAFWVAISPTGTLLVGSIFHDLGYRYNCQLKQVVVLDGEGGAEYKYEITHEDEGKKFMDENFKLINNHVNDATFMNGAAWATLRSFGFLGWNENRKKDRKIREDYKDLLI